MLLQVLRYTDMLQLGSKIVSIEGLTPPDFHGDFKPLFPGTD